MIPLVLGWVVLYLASKTEFFDKSECGRGGATKQARESPKKSNLIDTAAAPLFMSETPPISPSDPGDDGAAPEANVQKIAEATGLAKSTVSLALRGRPRVAPATRRRVLEAAAAMGYRPSPAMGALAARRWRGRKSPESVIAVLHPPGGAAARLPAGVEGELARLGYSWECHPVEAKGSQARLGKMLYHRGILGLLLPEHPLLRSLEDFPWQHFCAVQAGLLQGDFPVDMVRYNPFDTVAAAWARVARLGYRRIGGFFLHHDEGPCIIEAKAMAAFEYYQRRAPRDFVRIPGQLVPLRKADVALQAWLGEFAPDVVIGSLEMLHAALGTAAEKAGAAGGKPPAFVSLRVHPDNPRVAGFHNHQSEVMLVALRHLDQLIRSGRRGPAQPPRLTLVVEPQWKPGASLPEPAAGPR